MVSTHNLPAPYGPEGGPKTEKGGTLFGYTDLYGGYGGGQAPSHKRIDKLLKHVSDGDVRLDDLITHRLPLSRAPHGYDIFRQKKDGCVKVVLKPGE